MENKKITSTIILIILFVIVCLLCVWDFIIVTGINPHGGTPADGTGEGSVTGGAIVSFVVAMGLVAVIALSVHIIVISAICLKFSIRNTKDESKPVKVINIVLSCVFSAGVALGAIAIILYGVLVL